MQRIRRRYPAELAFLPLGLPQETAFEACYGRLQEHGHDLASALRITRNVVLERLAVCDCDLGYSVTDITQSMSALAQWALAHALLQTQPAHDLVGTAHTSFWVLGMGKLGARELNVSSDIDLICVYEQEGQTDGLQPISHSEYFQRWVRACCQLLAEVTEHGFVFRVDLALRPHGNSGPTALSLSALEDYLLVSGREWERLAWLKARVVASHPPQASRQALRDIVRPFVYRRYLDYGAFEALRQLHSLIRQHTNARAAGRPARLDDIKLGRGGIRELEFIVQVLQLVRGGQQPALRVRGSLSALDALQQAQHLSPATADQLGQAYQFLRRVEHRIQYLDDQQTHLLPQGSGDLTWLAQSMGFSESDSFLHALNQHRQFIAHEFDALLASGQRHSTQTGLELESSTQHLSAEQQRLLNTWLAHPRIRGLKESSDQRLRQLLSRSIEWLQDTQAPDHALSRFLDWLEPVLRRDSYLALLVERPVVHQRLLRLLTTARWPARYLTLHPAVIDELASTRVLHTRFDASNFEQALQAHWQLLHKSHEANEESAMGLLRQTQHAEVFRILMRDIEHHTPVQDVADELSALADSVLRISVQWAWAFMREKHCETPQIALIAYGKLGGKELGYGSDLDLVCLYDDDHDDAGALYAKLLRKLITWLSTPTAQGIVYDIDTALRPNGNSGLLVSRIDSYEQYQTQRGSNAAWTWEHQAMTRARCVLGSPGLAERFEAVRLAVLTAPRAQHALQTEILSMRERVRQAHRIPPGSFDVKHSPGGMVDVEFAVQYLVLLHAQQHSMLRHNSGNIALLQAAQNDGLIPAPLGQNAAQAYAKLRQLQHSARLDERSTRFPSDSTQQEQGAVSLLWQCVFEQSTERA